MKYLLLLGVVLAVLWLLRQARRKSLEPTRPPTAGQKPASPAEIVACSHCGVHLPRSEALTGASGRLYCGTAHRQEAQDG